LAPNSTLLKSRLTILRNDGAPPTLHVSAAAEDVVVLDPLRPVRKHLPFEAAAPELAMEIQSVGINVTITR
jgi:hypothetical protein